MKLISLKCPECKAELEFKDESKQILFCPYCGSKLLLQDDVKRIEKTVTVRNINERYDNKEVEKTKREKAWAEAEAAKARSENVPIILSLLFMLLCFGFLFYIYLDTTARNKEMISKGGLKISKTEKQYKGMNYESVTSELEAIGFTNITTIPDNDLWLSFDSKLYTVKSISVNGSSPYDISYYYLPNTPIVITYHDVK